MNPCLIVTGRLTRTVHSPFMAVGMLALLLLSGPYASAQVPTANAGGNPAGGGVNYVIAEGEDLVLDGSASLDPEGAGLIYGWRFVDTSGPYNDASGVNPTVTYATLRPKLGADPHAATFKVGLEVEDGSGDKDTAEVSLTVTPVDPIADATAGEPYAINEGDNLDLDGSASSDPGLDTITDWDWDLDNDGAYDDATGETPSITWAVFRAAIEGNGAAPIPNGLRTIGLRVTNDDGDTGTTTTTVNIANLVPTADAGGPYGIDEGDDLVLDGSASADTPGLDAITAWEWDLDNDGAYDDATGETPTVTWAVLRAAIELDGVDQVPNGLRTIGLRVTDEDGDTGTATTTFTITNLPPTAVPVAPATLDEGLDLVLDGSGSSDPIGLDTIIAWDWDLDNDGAYDDATGVNPTIVWADLKAAIEANGADPLPDGARTIGLQVTDEDGGLGTATTVFTITNLAPTANPGADFQIDEGNGLALSGSLSSDPGQDLLTYSWDLDNNGSGDTTGENPTPIAWVVLRDTYSFEVGGNDVVLTVTDTQNVANLPSAPVTVTVTVVNTDPTARDDVGATDEDTLLTADAVSGLLANDTDEGNRTLSVTGGSPDGIVADVNPGVPFFSVSGATVVLAADGSYTYDPANALALQQLAFGETATPPDTFHYSISDGLGGVAAAEVVITVTGVNDAPVARPESADVDEDGQVEIVVLANDSDVDNDVSLATVEVVVKPNWGTTGVDDATGVVTYAPLSDFDGDDEFTYIIRDDGEGHLASNEAVVSITVLPLNDPPNAVDDYAQIDVINTPVIINVILNDFDQESEVDPTSVAIFIHPLASEGTATANPDGTILFTPYTDFKGPVRFTYSVSDFGDGGSPPASSTAEVFVAVVLDDMTVTSSGDGVDFDIGPGALTLREATTFVASGGAITFAPSVTAIELDPLEGPIAITRDMNITGRPGADAVTVSGQNATGVFDCVAGTVVIDALVIDAGEAAGGNGGGVLVRAGATVTILNSVISNSGAANAGGGIHNSGTLTLGNTTLSGNSAGQGGGILNANSLILWNTTVMDNTAIAGDGGGLFQAAGAATVLNSTFFRNAAQAGGGIGRGAGVVDIRNTVVVGNTATASSGHDVLGFEFSSNGHNLLGDDAGSTGFESDLAGYEATEVVDVELRDNGGQMLTLALMPHSPAIDAGEDAAVTGVFGASPTDQRGPDGDVNGIDFIRIAGSAVDIGAYETHVYTVNSTVDADDLGVVNGSPSLRKALRLSYSGDTIHLPSEGQITVSKALGRLTVLNSVAIVGPGADLLSLDGNGDTQILYVQEPIAVVHVSGVTFANGYDKPISGGDGGGPLGDLGGTGGGALYNWGTVRLSDCTLRDNAVLDLDGGAIYSRGTLSLTRCLLDNNSASHAGGALFNLGGDVAVLDSSLENNTADIVGGAITNFLSGSVSLTNTTFSGNTAANAGAIRNSSSCALSIAGSTFSANESSSDGGAIVNLGALALANSTLSGNTADRNGGALVLSSGSAVMTNCTLTGNLADAINSGVAEGGGILVAGGALSLHNTIVAGNLDTPTNAGLGNIHPDLSGTATSLGHNFIGIANGTTAFVDGVNGDRVGTASHPLDPVLGPLGNYGGPTETHTPMAQSPVIDAGDSEGAGGGAASDQRSAGFDRIVDGDGDGTAAIDIGAVEFRTSAPFFNSVGFTGAVEDMLYLYPILTDDIDLQETLTVSALSIPSWLSLTDIFRQEGGSVILTIPPPIDTDKPIQWKKDEVDLDTEDPRVSGADTGTLTISMLTIADSGAYSAVYHDGVEERRFGPLNVEVVEYGLLPIPGVDDLDIVSLTPFLSGRPSNRDIGAPFVEATFVVLLQVEDWAHAQAQQYFVVTVLGVNDPPDTREDLVDTAEDTAIVIGVLDNDTDVDGLLNKASVSIASHPGHGSVTVDPVFGKVTYTPSPDYNGRDFFLYRVFDLGAPLPARASIGVVTLTVTAVNDPPRLGEDLVTVDEDGAVTIDVLANDIDVDGSIVPGTVFVPVQPAHGTVTVDPETGAITYTPEADYEGNDLIEYFVSDDGGPLPSSTGAGEVAVTVNGINDPPDTVEDEATTFEDTAVTIPVLDNDSDRDGQLVPPSVLVLSGPANGTASVNLDTGTITYLPAPDFTGEDSFEYAVSDNGSPGPITSSSGVVTVVVFADNDAPRLTNDLVTTDEDTALTIDVLANDSDVDGNLVAASVLVTSPPLNGSTSVDPATGAIEYVPDPNYNGIDHFDYRVADDGHPLPEETAIAHVSVTVNPINDAPATMDDAGSCDEDESVNIEVLSNDSDIDGNLDPASVRIVSGPENGHVVVDSVTGGLTYTPDHDFFGIDHFEYEVADDGTPLPGNTSTAMVTITVRVRDDMLITVNSLLDQRDEDYSPNDITLREAIAQLAPGGTIRFAADLTGAILLNASFGELVIDQALTIEGPGADRLIVSGDLATRVFTVNDGDSEANVLVSISGLTIADGAPGEAENGGAITNAETLTLRDCFIVDNQALEGGGIYNSGILMLHRSTLSANHATRGGGIMNTGSAVLASSTLSGNTSAGSGSGLFHDSAEASMLVNCTVTGNLANSDGIPNGGGGALYVIGSAEPLDVRNSIVAGNSDTPLNLPIFGIHPDVSGPFLGRQTNIVGTTFGSTGFGASDLVLENTAFTGPGNVIELGLAGNGGSVPTHALAPGSRAIDSGDSAYIMSPPLDGPPFYDNRGPGFPRESGLIDIGAVEAQEFCSLAPTIEMQLGLLTEDFGIETDDFDEDGIPEAFTAALIVEVICFGPFSVSELSQATQNAYLFNLASFEEEPQATELGAYWQILAVLMAISQDTQTALTDLLASAGIVLTGDYEVVTCEATGECAPKAVTAPGSEAYAGPPKALNEPYAGDGDLDGDGVSNVQEYENVLSRGGTVTDFADAAINPRLDGSQESAGCAAGQAPWSVGIGSSLGDLLTLCFLVALLGIPFRTRRVG